MTGSRFEQLLFREPTVQGFERTSLQMQACESANQASRAAAEMCEREPLLNTPEEASAE